MLRPRVRGLVFIAGLVAFGMAVAMTPQIAYSAGMSTLPATSPSVDSPLPVMPPQVQSPGERPPLTKQEAAAARAHQHIVVIYMQNNSFDKLYGRWGTVGGESVDGVANAPQNAMQQVNQDGKPIECALFNDVNLAPGALAGPATCTDRTGVKAGLYPEVRSPKRMAPFLLNGSVPASAITCPFPGITQANGIPANSSSAMAGGCTQDIVHQFYQEQYQLNGGKQNRYATGAMRPAWSWASTTPRACGSTST